MPFGVGVALGKKLIEKAVDSMGDAAVDAVKAPRKRKKKPAKARGAQVPSWVIGLVGIIMLMLLFGGRHLR